MRPSRILLIAMLLLSTLLISGCISQLTGSKEKQTTTRATTLATQPEVVCNPPYIASGEDCCLDRNQNNVCDSAESTQQSTEPSTTRQPTTIATSTTARTTATNQDQTTTTIKQQCSQGYYDNDPACGQNCPARQMCVKSGITIQYAGQTINCYQCKEACPADDPEYKYYYDDPNCGGECNITGGWYCFQSVIYPGCYLCQRPCPAYYYYKDVKCGDKCAAETQCTKSTQLPDCYWCKSPCPEGYYYKDPDCGEDCKINEKCEKTTTDCYLCVRKCDIGYYYKDNTCNSTCDEEEEYCGTLLGTQDCYYCKANTTTTSVTTTTASSTTITTITSTTTQETSSSSSSSRSSSSKQSSSISSSSSSRSSRLSTTTTTIVQCGGELYSNSNCDGRCDSTCETCVQYQTWPCYYCQKNCSRIGAGWGTSSVCNTCDLQHEDCVEHDSCDGCYHCVELCPENLDYYRFQGCDADCDARLCRKVSESQPQSQYKDCYMCYPPECGNELLEPGEECEFGPGQTCQDTWSGAGKQYLDCDQSDCLCYPNCNRYCAGQGNDGYQRVQGILNKAACEAGMNAKMAAMNCGTQWKCGAYSWFNELHGVSCCCVDVQCGQTEAACKAKL